MISFLLVISFIIDGVLVLGLLTLMNRVKKAEELELRQKQVANEIEDLFTSYLMELKEENNRMSELVQASQRQSRSNDHDLNREAHSTLYSPEVKQAFELPTDSYTPPKVKVEEDEEVYEPSQHSRIIEMGRKGHSIEDIAKKLDKGKTEVELLLKLHQKK
ncbi:hypothetical protein [Halobacillus sp. BBL2006]|uniref:DUF6115 domain-containing protein n=1 Tax=Halobacillus sp. BBL2006 TaxID=1543706 RepID=UPI000542B235|nr:hypothetical protein [Halobacillus sp. BBL2006]KHE67503.1 hypothetical protein LD39_17210 [Halobacillus sp. BBL2006]